MSLSEIVSVMFGWTVMIECAGDSGAVSPVEGSEECESGLFLL